MRTVSVTVDVPGQAPADVFQKLGDFERYPELTEAVRSVSVERLGDGKARSTWEVDFREGVLEWVEEDSFDEAAGTIAFQEVDGDFEQFEGVWRVVANDDGSAVHFDATIDIGLDTLGSVIEPIAERSLRENVVVILTGLFGAGVSERSA
jgi:ribosome-associated toxin RatA of RatAB toxin-antitoxin module